MQTRQIVSPKAITPEALPTFGGDADANRFRVATPHFTVAYRRIAANATYAGTKFDIAVPTSLSERQVYVDIGAESGVPDVGS